MHYHQVVRKELGMSRGNAIELENKFDWSEDSVLLYTTHGCTVILQGEYEDIKDLYFVVLDFSGVRTIRGASTDCTPAFGIQPKNIGASFVAEIYESDWDNEAHLKYTYSGTPKSRELKHFVISNHDVFHEILGESFDERKVSQGNTEFEMIKSAYILSKAQIV